MKKLSVILLAGALVACGGDDKSDLPSIDAAKRAASEAGEAISDAADSAGDAASEAAQGARDAAAGAADSAREAASDAAAAAGDSLSNLAADGADDGQSATCLQLVGQGEFSQAIPVCTAALAANPTNQQVKDALATAKAEGADMAAGLTGAAKEGAAEAAGGAAKDAASDALGGVMGQ